MGHVARVWLAGERQTVLFLETLLSLRPSPLFLLLVLSFSLFVLTFAQFIVVVVVVAEDSFVVEKERRG